MLTFTSTVTVTIACGEKPETHEVRVREGCETALTLLVDRIEIDINALRSRGHYDKARDIAALHNEIIGMIRIVTMLTGIYPSQMGLLVASLRIAAGDARRRADARRKP